MPQARRQLCSSSSTPKRSSTGRRRSRARRVGVTAIQEVGRLQTVLAPYRLKPTYVIDYPVATTPSSVARLGEFAARGECQIGAHLHPWVNPPFVEPLSARDELRLQSRRRRSSARRSRVLTRRDRASTSASRRASTRPAGTGSARRRRRFWSRSVRRGRQRESAHGLHGRRRPVVRGLRARPSTSAGARRLLELPCTTGFIGAARRIGPALHRAASARWLQPFRAVGILARSGLAQQDHAVAGGNTLDEMKALTDALCRRRRAHVRADVSQPEPEAGLHALRHDRLPNATRFSRRSIGTAIFSSAELGGVANDAGRSVRLSCVQGHIDMKVLGISPLDKDSTVTLVEDGVITYAAAEERFTRVKLQDGFPWQALEDALERTGTDGRGDRQRRLSVPGRTTRRRGCSSGTSRKEREFLDETEIGATTEEMREARRRGAGRRDRRFPGCPIRTRRWKRACSRALAYRVLASEGVVSRNVAKRGSEQWGRDAHGVPPASGSRSSRPALGELGLRRQAEARRAPPQPRRQRLLHQRLRRGAGRHARRLRLGPGRQRQRRPRRADRAVARLEFPHSLGTFYESVTSALGFKPSRHEGKIVGLAAYGDPEVLGDVLLRAVRRRQRRLPHRRDQQRLLRAAAGERSSRRSTSPPPTSACSKRSRPPTSRSTSSKTGLQNLVLSGGVVANVKLNQRLREIDGVDGIFVHPNMGDGGCGTGAALLEFAGSQPTRAAAQRRLPRAASSPTTQIAEALQRAQLPFTRVHADRAEDRRCSSRPARSWRASTAAWSTARARSATARSSITPRSRR